MLPEPLLTTPDVAEDIDLAQSVSMALMIVLETLSPVERAVFVLREVFNVDYDEIAAAVDKSPAAVRQIAHRARQHVEARHPRNTVSPDEMRTALTMFQRAVEARDLQGLLDVLAPDAVFVSDGGGVAPAARKPIVGGYALARTFVGHLGKLESTVTGELTYVNGNLALLMRIGGKTDGVLVAHVEMARITAMYYIRNPQKLMRVDKPTRLTLR